MCGSPEWKPQFANGQLSEASENAAYAVALEQGGSGKCTSAMAVGTAAAADPCNNNKQSDSPSKCCLLAVAVAVGRWTLRRRAILFCGGGGGGVVWFCFLVAL